MRRMLLDPCVNDEFDDLGKIGSLQNGWAW
jgi:hypothetical protein